MGADRLEELLTQADAALPPPRSGASLSERVRARSVRRARTQIALTAIAMIAMLMASVYLMRPRAPVVINPHVMPPGVNVAALRQRIASLDAEAAMHQRIAAELAAFQQENDALERTRIRAVLAEGSPSYIQEARDRAARILLIDADRLVATHTAQALDDYRRAIELFPETSAAQEAVRRLKAAGA